MQETCGYCSHRFFGDDDDYINGSWCCSYCKPKRKECLICGKGYLGLNKGDELGLCKECREEGFRASGLTNHYLILRFKVLQRDHWTCRYCGRSPITDIKVELHVDHIHPRSKDGTSQIENLVTACQECNKGKLDFLLTASEQLEIKKRRRYDGESHSSIAAEGVDEMATLQVIECDVADYSYVGKRYIQTQRKPSTEAHRVKQPN